MLPQAARVHGGHGGGGGFHKDSAYLLEAPSDALATILLSLDSTSPGRGNTRVCPRSHVRKFQAEELKPDLGIKKEVIGGDFVDCPLEPGDALIIHPHVSAATCTCCHTHLQPRTHCR